MIREKQIDEFAYSQVDCEFFDERLYEGIVIGANWADEHPKPEMVNKQEFIEKARKWIEKNFKSDGYFSLYYLGGSPYTPENIAKDFCKTMEE